MTPGRTKTGLVSLLAKRGGGLRKDKAGKPKLKAGETDGRDRQRASERTGERPSSGAECLGSPEALPDKFAFIFPLHREN